MDLLSIIRSGKSERSGEEVSTFAWMKQRLRGIIQARPEHPPEVGEEQPDVCMDECCRNGLASGLTPGGVTSPFNR